jgi:hypothetical protein
MTLNYKVLGLAAVAVILATAEARAQGAQSGAGTDPKQQFTAFLLAAPAGPPFTPPGPPFTPPGPPPNRPPVSPVRPR